MWYFTARMRVTNHHRSANELTDIRFHPCGIAQPVSDARLRHRIDFFSENQGNLIDKDITNPHLLRAPVILPMMATQKG